MTIEYCESCKRKLTEADFQSGRAVWVGKHSLCRHCSEACSPNQRPAPGVGHPQNGVRGSGPRRAVTPGRGAPASARGSSGLGRAVPAEAAGRPGGLNGSASASPRRTPLRVPAVPAPGLSVPALWFGLLGALLGLAAAGCLVFLLLR